MPTRRQFEMTVLVIVLMAPALSMVRLWTRKHLATTASQVTADAAAVVGSVI